MDNKDLITRFAEDCFRFEAMQQEIDGLIADEVSEVLIYEYEDLANQAAEIVLKLSANGNNLGLNFYRYYVERLEYIIDYFRALLDYEETPLAEDEPNELDDEPAAEAHFEGFPAGCAFPKLPESFFGGLKVGENWTAKNEENAATDEAGAGALLPPEEESEPLSESLGWEELPSEDKLRVKETIDMWGEMNVITGRYGGGGKRLPTAEILRRGSGFCVALTEAIASGSATDILAGEVEVRRIIWKAIDDIPRFRYSEKFEKLIERFPTYNEIEEL